MANCNENGVAHSGSNLQIEAIQSVMPTKSTDPRLIRQVLIGENPGSSNFQRRFHMVFCYNKASETDSGWMVAGWIRESLGRTLDENPLLAGRLRRKGENDTNGEFEIVSNDSGVRLIEAKVPMNLADFLDLKDKENVEAELVFWEDIHEPNPQYSPLFYVQVTNFNCGRYSIGISCSLFLADPYGMTSFLNRWSKIHINMVSEADMPKIPTFFLPNLRKTGCSPTLPSSSNTCTNQVKETLIFKLPSKFLNLRDDIHKNLAEKCVEEAEDKLGKKLSSKFCLFVRENSQDIKAETFSREGIVPFGNIDTELVSANWVGLKLADSIRFSEENKAVHFSCWIVNSGNEDLVLITPSDIGDEGGSGKNVIVIV
ncbi:rosmarinate synthase-like [Lycium barbarum]|uniref:rosmarinate synthase-like n=1 Tax=Lycium barbarum TaxID=112863 RepID=UPI00293ED2F5|nr:rosmarinate synthase-like [Lycium barbarum]